MKTKLLLIFLCISGICYSQISITHSDFQNAFEPGAIYLNYATPIDGPPVTVFVGEASAVAQQWDFTDYTWNYYGKSWGIVPSAAPLIGDFPSANLVLFEKTWILGPDTIYTFNYKELTDDKLFIWGVSDSTTILFTYPPAIQALVPLTYGQSWVRQRDSVSILPGYYVITEGLITMDAFGTMKIPTGEFPCLRLTHDSRSIVVTPVSRDTTLTRGYHFYSQGLIEVNLIGIPEDQFNLPTVTADAIKLSRPENQAGIDEHGLLSGTFLLDQNFPNPFGSKTTITFRLSVNSHVTLKVLNSLGKEVATLVNEQQPVGDHEVVFDARGLPGGVYFYRIQTEDGSQTKKMTLYQ